MENERFISTKETRKLLGVIHGLKVFKESPLTFFICTNITAIKRSREDTAV